MNRSSVHFGNLLSKVSKTLLITIDLIVLESYFVYTIENLSKINIKSLKSTDPLWRNLKISAIYGKGYRSGRFTFFTFVQNGMQSVCHIAERPSICIFASLTEKLQP